MHEGDRFRLITAADQRPSPWGSIALEGQTYGSGVSMFIIDYAEVGFGPKLHKHPYPETWVVRRGNARFHVDGQEMTATDGDVVVCDAETPHKFVNEGPGSLDIICIHPSPRFIQEDLE